MNVREEKQPKLLFFVTEDWYFRSHRLPLALAAKKIGYRVTVVTRVREHREQIERSGLKLVPIELSRGGLNPIADLRLLRELIRIYRIEKPDIVHHVGMKPALYGSIAARWAHVAAIVNAFGGLGYLFSSTEWRAHLLRSPVSWLLRVLLNAKNSMSILQTEHDFQVLLKLGIRHERMLVIRGAGVDLEKFTPRSEPTSSPMVLLACRLLWDKGVSDFVDAARRLRARATAARFVIVGQPDLGNPKAISVEQMRRWQDTGDIEWWGYRDDMPAVFAASAVVCLPTVYGEGVPKVLIEAAACARPLVVTDLPGCKEIVRHGENGLIVPPRSPQALAAAIEQLIADPTRRAEMGRRGREIVEREFSLDLVVRQTLGVYRNLLAHR